MQGQLLTSCEFKIHRKFRESLKDENLFFERSKFLDDFNQFLIERIRVDCKQNSIAMR